MEYRKYYLDKLYPLQDKFLSFFNQSKENPFYLTGGTVLSRFCFQHRYSDDLDFFSKEELKDFRSIVSAILNTTKKQGFAVEVENISDHFFRIFIIEKETILKIDFVNEVTFHWAEFNNFPLFNNVDNEQNI